MKLNSLIAMIKPTDHAKIAITTAGRIAVLIIAYLSTGTSQAQTSDDAEPGFTGAMGLQIIYDDNIYRSESNQVNDLAFILTPNLDFIGVFSKHRLDIGYSGAYASYSDNSDESFNDSKFNFDFLMDLSSKFTSTLGASYVMAHDSRGSSGTSTLQSLEPDTWDELGYYLDMTYGRRTSQAQVQVKYVGNSRQYTNNNQSLRDRGSGSVLLTAFYNSSARSSYLLEIRSKTISYTEANSTDRDSTETSYFLGSRWDFTGITTGNFRFGSLNKDLQGDVDLNGNTLEDFSGFVAEGSVEWTPKRNSKFVFGVTRKANESSEEQSSYFISNMLNLSWQRDISSILAFNTSIGYQNDEFSSGRSDDHLHVSFRGGYDITDRANMGLNYSYGSRSSTLVGSDYSSNVLVLTGTFTTK